MIRWVLGLFLSVAMLVGGMSPVTAGVTHGHGNSVVLKGKAKGHKKGKKKSKKKSKKKGKKSGHKKSGKSAA